MHFCSCFAQNKEFALEMELLSQSLNTKLKYFNFQSSQKIKAVAILSCAIPTL